MKTKVLSCLNIMVFLSFLGNMINAQSISGCDFFPDKEEITITYIKSFLENKNKIEFKYIYQGNVMIEGKTYKAYNVFVNGSVPEVNQVLYVNCEANSLVLGNGIYAFNRQVVGYSQDITKIVDFNATPIFNIGMVNTGDFYLPSVIKPNNAIGETWTETNYIHGNQFTIKRTILKKDIQIEVLGVLYENVYLIKKETWINGGEKFSDEDVYFGKGVGLIKIEENKGEKNEAITELDFGLFDKEGEIILREINDIIEKLPVDSDFDIFYQELVKKRNELSIDQLIAVRDTMTKVLNQYQLYINDSINKQNEEDSETAKKVKTFSEIESNLKSKGIIDHRLLGTWKLTTTGKSFFKFYKDGMVEIYKNSIGTDNIVWQKHLFRITNGNTLERLYHLYNSNDFGHVKYHIDFDVDKNSGKPLIHLKLIYYDKAESRPQRERDEYYNNKITTYIKMD